MQVTGIIYLVCLIRKQFQQDQESPRTDHDILFTKAEIEDEPEIFGDFNLHEDKPKKEQDCTLAELIKNDERPD